MEQLGSSICSDLEERYSSSGNQVLMMLQKDATQHLRLMMELEKWCWRHFDRYKRLHVLGQRPASTNANKYAIERVNVPCYSPSGNGVRAAISNAFSALDGAIYRRDEFLKGKDPSESLSMAGVWLAKAMGKYALRNTCSTKGGLSEFRGSVNRSKWFLWQEYKTQMGMEKQ